MKKITLILLSILALSSWSSCNKIAEGDRLILAEVKLTGRTVLLEDYTGVYCVNCPFAAVEVENIHKVHRNKFIPISIHGMDAFTPKKHKLYSEDGAIYRTELAKPNSLPAASFNRTKLADLDGKYVSESYPVWGKYVAAQRALPQVLELTLTANISGTNEVEVSCKAAKTEEYDIPAETKLKMQFLLLEDGIVSPQSSKDKGTIEDYVHNHVLRQALNTTWGEDYTVEDTHSGKYQITRDGVEIKNCSVVAFVYNADTKEVYESAIVKL